MIHLRFLKVSPCQLKRRRYNLLKNQEGLFFLSSRYFISPNKNYGYSLSPAFFRTALILRKPSWGSSWDRTTWFFPISHCRAACYVLSARSATATALAPPPEHAQRACAPTYCFIFFPIFLHWTLHESDGSSNVTFLPTCKLLLTLSKYHNLEITERTIDKVPFSNRKPPPSAVLKHGSQLFSKSSHFGSAFDPLGIILEKTRLPPYYTSKRSSSSPTEPNRCVRRYCRSLESRQCWLHIHKKLELGNYSENLCATSDNPQYLWYTLKSWP